jgi:hypothetical protein
MRNSSKITRHAGAQNALGVARQLIIGLPVFVIRPMAEDRRILNLKA